MLICVCVSLCLVCSRMGKFQIENGMIDTGWSVMMVVAFMLGAEKIFFLEILVKANVRVGYPKCHTCNHR